MQSTAAPSWTARSRKASPTAPLSAAAQSKLQLRSCSSRISRLTGLSSMTSTRAPVTSTGTMSPSDTASCTGRETANQKIEPRPTSLSTPMRPPIRSTSRAAMASPSPVPSWRRVEEESTCANFSNTLCNLSAGMPMPVSSTRTLIRAAPSTISPPTSISTWPFSVNFTALPSRLVTIWRKRPASPTTKAGRRGSTRTMSSMFFSATRAETSVATSSTASARRNGAGSRVSWPALILEKSRMSLMMVSNALPDFTMTSVKVFWRGVSSVLASSSAMPSTPFMGVRISWLILARNSDLARSAASALNRESALSAKARRIAFSMGRKIQKATAARAAASSTVPQVSSLSLWASASRRSASMAVRARTSMGCANSSFWLRISR